MIPDIPKKIELIFWDHVIAAASDNSRLNNVVSKGVVFINSDPARGVRIFYGILAVCGFSLGAICFLIIHPV
jgi:hypothetical protein